MLILLILLILLVMFLCFYVLSEQDRRLQCPCLNKKQNHSMIFSTHPRIAPTPSPLSLHNKTQSRDTPYWYRIILLRYPPPPPVLFIFSAFGTMVKELLSDTNLVVAGTVLTLALCLSAEEGSEPRRFLGSVFGVFRRLVFGVDESSGLKEL